MLNKAILIGRLTANPELKTTPNGTSVCSFTLAVDRPYQKGKERETDFISCIAWRGTAEFICKYFTKGGLISVDGSIQTRRYQDKHGNNRAAVEVLAAQVGFVESKKAEKPSSEPGAALGQSDFQEIDTGDDLPF